MGWIALLILIGTLLFFAELVLLPGITIAGIGAFCSYVAAAVLAFILFDGIVAGFVTIGVILLIILIMMIFFLRPKTWNKVALHAEIKDSFETKAEETISIGAEGETLTRLAPMGKVVINGKTFEAKSLDSFIDQKRQVVVTDFDNSSLIVKLK